MRFRFGFGFGLGFAFGFVLGLGLGLVCCVLCVGFGLLLGVSGGSVGGPTQSQLTFYGPKRFHFNVRRLTWLLLQFLLLHTHTDTRTRILIHTRFTYFWMHLAATATAAQPHLD